VLLFYFDLILLFLLLFSSSSSPFLLSLLLLFLVQSPFDEEDTDEELIEKRKEGGIRHIRLVLTHMSLLAHLNPVPTISPHTHPVLEFLTCDKDLLADIKAFDAVPEKEVCLSVCVAVVS
jgi:hypothetical protein